MIRAVDVRCTGNKGPSRGLLATLFWPQDPSEGPPKLKQSSILNSADPHPRQYHRELPGLSTVGSTISTSNP